MQKFLSKLQENKSTSFSLILLIFFSLIKINYGSFSEFNGHHPLKEIFLSRSFQNTSNKIEIVKTLNPTLKWYRVRNAIKYMLIIKEYEGESDKSPPIIIRTFTITDTFFIIPSPLLVNGKHYSWNVKSFDGKSWGKFGDEYYFKVVLTNKATDESKLSPESISPGTLFPDFEIINAINPEFKWFSLPDAVGYYLTIEKEIKPGSYQKFFSSENLEIIKDTSFILFGNLLKNNEKYRWSVKAILNAGSSQPSEFRYFKLILPKVLIKPYLYYPGYKVEGKEVVSTLTPTFVWKKINEAEKYSIAISKKSEGGVYKLIFDTENKYRIIDTSFTIPEGILENNSFLRWNLKVVLKDGRSFYSNRLYFKVSKSEQSTLPISNTLQEPEIDREEILLNMEYAGILNAYVSSIYAQDVFFISFNEFIANLKIPVNQEDVNQYLILLQENENPIVVDFNDKQIIRPDKTIEFNDADFLNVDGEIFVTTQLLEKILSIHLNIDFSNLNMIVSSDKPLPVYQKFLLERKYASFKKGEKEKSLPLLFGRERYFLNGFVMDYSFNQILVNKQRSNYLYGFGIAGELLYGDFSYSRQEFRSVNYSNRIENFNWEFTPNPNNYVTQLVIGDHFVDGINLYSYRGIGLTNEVVQPRTKIGNYLYQDKADPNSLIELYSNQELIDITKSDVSGNYSFLLPLNYGMSNFEFRIHKLSGEIKSFRRIYQIPYDFLPAGILNYKINAGELRFTKDKIAYGELIYGLNDFMTFSGGTEYIKGSSVEQWNYFGKSSFRISSNVLFNIFYSPKIYSKINWSFVTPNYASYRFEFTNYKQNKYYNPAKLIRTFDGNLYIPFKIGKTNLNIISKQVFLKSEFYKRYDLDLGLYLLYNWFSFTTNFSGENLEAASILKRRELSVNATINSGCLTKNISVINNTVLSTRTNFNLIDKNLLSYSFFATTTLFKNLRLQINAERLVRLKITNVNINLLLELPYTRYLLNSNGKDVINHQIYGSVGYSSQINTLYFYSEPQINRSAVYIEGFQDKNGNSQKDSNEDNLKGLDFIINSASQSRKLKNNGILILGLNSYQDYDIKINESALVQPNLSYGIPEFRITTDGNRLKIIRLPYYETGEIGGVVVRSFEGEEIPLSNVRLIIKNLDTDKEIMISTFDDGSFYYYGLRKGRYSIKIDQKYLERISLISKPEQFVFEIDPVKNQYSIEDIKFLLE